MSDLEALMWNLEKDPYLASSFANITFLDQPPDAERLRHTLARVTEVVRRLRQRVVPGFGRFAPPEWRDDPDFDLDYHVRTVGVPSPHDDRAMLDLATQLATTPLDRTRPLWQYTLVEGLTGGRAAMVQRMHHTITDGEGGVRMSVEFIDFERDAPERPPVEPTDPEPVVEGLAATIADTVGHNVRRQLGLARRAASGLAGLVAHPSRVPVLGETAVETARSALRQVTVGDHARSPLWTERSLRRRLEVLRVPLDDAKRAAKALGGSVNDLFVTAAAGGAGAYHQVKGNAVDELRIAMPVSTRSKGSTVGNAFAPSRVLVPVGIDDPMERFAAIHDRLAVVKRERALGLVAGVAGVANLLPTSVMVRLARQQVETVDFTVSNVRGAPFDLYIAGARIDANYPMGPLAGTAFNLTLLSTGNWLDMGLHIDAAAIDDPELLRVSIEDAFAELLAAGRQV